MRILLQVATPSWVVTVAESVFAEDEGDSSPYSVNVGIVGGPLAGYWVFEGGDAERVYELATSDHCTGFKELLDAVATTMASEKAPRPIDPRVEALV